METQIYSKTLLENEREKMIALAYSERKGREDGAVNPFTCYICVDSAQPDLRRITASYLEEAVVNSSKAFLWSMNWDKSIVVISPGKKVGCTILESDNPKGRIFVPVSTTSLIQTDQVLKCLPSGELALIVINNKPMTLEAFLISYFHMVNQLIWDEMLSLSPNNKPEPMFYKQALERVLEKGFSTITLSEEEILMAKKIEPSTSLRIYGSKVNKSVPEIMGAVIR